MHNEQRTHSRLRLHGAGSVDAEVAVLPTARRQLFTPETLAAYLNISERTLRELLRQREIPSYKLGGSRRIAPEDVDAWLRAHRDENVA